MLAFRKQSSVFGRGEFKLLAPGNRTVLGPIAPAWTTTVMLGVSNTSQARPSRRAGPRAVRRARAGGHDRGGSAFPPIGQLTFSGPAALGLYGSRRRRCRAAEMAQAAPEAMPNTARW